MEQPSRYIDFADQRTMWGIPNAWDTLSNVPYALLGLLGFCWMFKIRAIGFPSQAYAVLMALAFGGFLLTGIGSGYFHWVRTLEGLAWDRAAMVIIFAGLVRVTIAERFHTKHALLSAVVFLLGGWWANVYWFQSGNLWPWVVLQGGGSLLLLWLAFIPPVAMHTPQGTSVSAVNIWAIVVLYGIAKILEATDAQTYHLTWEMVSGHSLKHLVSAFTAWVLMQPLIKLGRA